ncbi:MAG: nucleotidyltransferase family protein [Desulfurococcales archaeon]|nr:nucleotidyltransferase family protein [Desulfurococcales archaeon]
MSRIYAAILAAGASTRFPGSKLLYKLKGKPLVTYSVESALNSELVDRVIVVAGYDFNRVLQALQGYDVDIILNGEYWKGMSSSVRLVASRLRDPRVIVFHPADVPLVSPKAFDMVVEEILNGALISVASFRDRKGHPIAFHGSLQPELMYVSEEGRGLKQVVNRYRESVVVVDVDEPGVLVDVDSASDIDRLHAIIKS